MNIKKAKQKVVEVVKKVVPKKAVADSDVSGCFHVWVHDSGSEIWYCSKCLMTQNGSI